MMSLFSICFDLLAILRISKNEKDLEILILRQPVRIFHRKTVPGREQNRNNPIRRRNNLGGIIPDYQRQSSSQVFTHG
jgi:hypothetical protein